MSGGIGVTADTASRILRDHLTSSARRAAQEVEDRRRMQLQACAGTSSRALLTVRPPGDVQAGSLKGKESGPPGSPVRPSAPAPRGWTLPSGGNAAGRASCSIDPGDPVSTVSPRNERAMQRAEELDA